MFINKSKRFFTVIILLLLLSTTAWSATIIVDRDNDSGNGFCTLRQAVLSANFNLALAGCQAGEDNVVDEVVIDVAGPILLTQGEIPVFGALRITINSGQLVRIKAAPDSRIFNVNSPDANDNNFSIYNLSLTDGNAGTENGGAILIEDAGEVAILNSWFLNNSAENGGAIYGNGSTVENFTLFNTQFINNGASNTGGALYGQNLVGAGLLNINQNVFKDNFAQFGGAIYLSEGFDTITFLNNKFTGNIASDSGGGVFLSGLSGGQTFDMDSSLFYNNQAVDSGGAIRLFPSTTRLNLINSTLSHNYADYGGAISNTGGNLQVSTSTFVYNFAQTGGANFHTSTQSINSIGHSIVAHPIGQSNCGGVTTLFYSNGANVSDDVSCGFNEPSDTMGDPHLTGLVEVQSSYGYYPTVYSPALDNSQEVLGLCLDSSSAAIMVDQLGTPRDMDGDGDGIGECDAGAIEAFANTDLIFYDSFGVDD
jgi:predicted outer membrane repeat protein